MASLGKIFDIFRQLHVSVQQTLLFSVRMKRNKKGKGD